MGEYVENVDASAMILSTRLGHILQGNDAEVLFTAHTSLRDIEVQFVTDIRQPMRQRVDIRE